MASVAALGSVGQGIQGLFPREVLVLTRPYSQFWYDPFDKGEPWGYQISPNLTHSKPYEIKVAAYLKFCNILNYLMKKIIIIGLNHT